MNLLAVPKEGFRRSVNKDNCDLMVVADWIEGSALFMNRAISRMDVWDFLCTDYYSDQSKAMTFVEMVWTELRRRNQWLNASPAFKVSKDKIEAVGGWQDLLGYSFCLMLTFLQRYDRKKHKTLHTNSYVKQGSLFEELSDESFVKLGWKTLRTGWASGISNPKFELIVNQVATELNEDWINAPGVKLFKKAKEEGLDLVIHRPFSDPRWGRAYYLVQCASGADWSDKLHTPNLEVWDGGLICFTTKPRRGFCFPLALDDDEFRSACKRCSGLFVDRFRLLSAGTGVTSMLSPGLQKGLDAWLAPRVKALPKL